MNENFEDELRRRLRAVDAPEGFAERLMAALPPDRKSTVVAFIPKASRPVRQFGVPAALAASLLGAVFFGMHVANERRAAATDRHPQANSSCRRCVAVKLDLAYET
jgi:hypothetical protein